MKVAVLPLNVTEGTSAAIGRQFSNIATETVRAACGADITYVNYLGQVVEDGVQKSQYVNMGNAVMERQFFQPLFKEASFDRVMHGLITQNGDEFNIHVRVDVPDSEEPIFDEQHTFQKSDFFKELHWFVLKLSGQAGENLPPALQEKFDVGTSSVDAFLEFMEGYDGFLFVQQANGQITNTFNLNDSMQHLLNSLQLDRSYQPSLDTAIQYCRACAHYKIGQFQDVERTLQTLTSLYPEDFRPLAALGEIYQELGNIPMAAEFYEKAIAAHQNLGDDIGEQNLNERGSLYARLGMCQLNMGMPVNAERHFRQAIELEGGDRPTLDLLANVLQQTGREHEVPSLWKEEIERNPMSAHARARFGSSLVQLGRKEEGIQAFDKALEELEDKVLVKRFYAPMLAEMGDLDRAMDFYEDCLDVAPNDIQLMIEYANTLKAADREFEVPQVLRNILASNPDAPTRAQAQAWLIEIEQPKRAEAVDSARQMLENGDAEAAIRDLKPLRNWLADYWKLWAILAAAYNRVSSPEEAQDAANRLLNLFPTYEPGYAELVNALTSQGRTEEAYNVMRHAVNNIGTLAVHLNLALAAKRAGHEEEARQLARQIRNAVGPNEELEQSLAEIEA